MIHFILNPNAGTNSLQKRERIVKTLTAIPNSKVWQTERVKHASELTKIAISEGATKVIAIGGDGTINDKDLYQYKSADPKVFLGLTSNFTYKKWNAGFILRASIGNYMYNNVYSAQGRYTSISSLATYLGNASSNYLDTKFNGITGGVNQLQSDYYVQNASFLKMDNLNVGYNVGKVLGNTASLRVNASVQNVFTITKYKGLDPEIGGGIDNNFYPRPRIVSLGLNLDF